MKGIHAREPSGPAELEAVYLTALRKVGYYAVCKWFHKCRFIVRPRVNGDCGSLDAKKRFQ